MASQGVCFTPRPRASWQFSNSTQQRLTARTTSGTVWRKRPQTQLARNTAWTFLACKFRQCKICFFTSFEDFMLEDPIFLTRHLGRVLYNKIHLFSTVRENRRKMKTWRKKCVFFSVDHFEVNLLGFRIATRGQHPSRRRPPSPPSQYGG